MTVLVIGGDNDAFLIAAVLREVGADVATIGLGVDGIDAAIATRVELVIVDVLLPDMEGLEVGRRLRAYASHPFRMVALAGIALPAVEQQVAAAGFDQLLIKPVDSNALRRLVTEAPSR